MQLTTLGDCLREFSREEMLTGSEQWYCRRCGVHVNASKALSVWKLPPVLMVHLKRFRYDAALRGGEGSFGQSVSCQGAAYNGFGRTFSSSAAKKLGHRVTFDLEGLDFFHIGGVLPHDSPQKTPPVFDLTGVVDHFGSCGFGHYTAMVRHARTSDWHRFDDEDISRVHLNDVPSDRSYILFYRKRASSARRQTLHSPLDWPHVV
eukprot:TRINITY_DN18291_c0_g1_i3.p1 TRINITY_DN18291_c0_g1~~TRINITY_DN18291_c0_g1_i3.p1  ORF type:complete len:205 (+),score=11.57 TRINITY_DN18291_c0_g1_i3:82-696(+)